MRKIECRNSMAPFEYPSVVVFDLDYTLWPLWCDTHISMPLKAQTKRKVLDRYGTEIAFYKDVELIFLELEAQGVIIVGASRTATPRVAQELLSLLHIGEKPAIKYFYSLQWGQGSKIKHISKAAKELGMVNELKQGEFVLFDDEYRNSDVKSINCTFVHLDDESIGLTRRKFEKGIESWKKKNALRQ
jgi:magnesium-dependent phosphatase 1